MKKVIIKAMLGPYDFWADPRIVEPDTDYILFTDQNIKSKVYDVRKVKRKPKLERLIKINPWEYAPGYDHYTWVDTNIHPTAERPNAPKADIVCLQHPSRNCVYEEFIACVQLKKDDPDVMGEQINRYREQGYPENNGMVQTGLLMRHMNDAALEHASIWSKEVENGSRRDQLSFNYAMWLMQVQPSVFAIQFEDFQKYYKLTPHKR